MKKRIIMMFILSLIVLVLAACTSDKHDSEEHALEPEEERAVLSQFAEEDGSVWQDSWMDETVSGDSIKVDINAEVKVPQISQMSTVEVRKYEFSSENKKNVAEAVFDDEIYYGDVEKLPRSELEVLLEEEREDLQNDIESWQEIGTEDDYELYKEDYEIYKSDLEKDMEQEREQIEKYEEMVRNASEDYVKVQRDD